VIQQFTSQIEGINIPTIELIDTWGADRQRRRRGAHLAPVLALGDTSADFGASAGVTITIQHASDTSIVVDKLVEVVREAASVIDSSQFQSFTPLSGTQPRFLFHPSSATDQIHYAVTPALHLQVPNASTLWSGTSTAVGTAPSQSFLVVSNWGASKSELRRRMRKLFFQSREERFESGIESSLAAGLTKLLADEGESALTEFRQLLFQPATIPDLAAEAIKAIARIERGISREQSRELLESGLMHLSALVRDAAVLGLATLGDAKSVPALTVALQHEPVPELREDLKQLLSELRLR
jgi:hypothetical protein